MFVQEDMKSLRTSLREVAGAGEPLNPEIIEQVRDAWGLTIRDFFGQTETTAQIGNPPGMALKEGSMGKPLPGYRIVLLDPDDKPAEEGEVCIALNPAPTGLMMGYQGDDGAILPAGEAFYRTGDVANRDQDGYLTYVGRADDVFKASDYRISPFELESVLIEHEAVAEAAVVPAPDAMRMAVPKAFIALAPGAEANAATMLSIFQHLRGRLSPFKRVRRLEVHELPKTISGKIRRVELRQLEEKRFAAGTRPEGEHREEDFPELRQG
jgi:acetyl-CoA synthetase